MNQLIYNQVIPQITKVTQVALPMNSVISLPLTEQIQKMILLFDERLDRLENMDA